MRTLKLSRLGLVGLAAPLLLLALACDDETKPGVELPDLSSPAAVFEALHTAYRNRDVALYREILAPKFRFRFQPGDAAEFQTDSWTDIEDVAGTAALFQSRLVLDIRVDLAGLDPVEPSETSFAEDVRMIRVVETFLEVEERHDYTLRVADRQDFYFRPGREAEGEDPDRWYLLEWRDIPSGSGPRPGGLLPVFGTTWGSLKWRFL